MGERLFRILVAVWVLCMGGQSVVASPSDLDVARGKVADGDHAAAVPYYEAHIASSPPDASSYLELGSAQLAAGDPVGGALSLRRALLLDPMNQQAAEALRGANNALGLSSESPEILDTIVSHVPLWIPVVGGLLLIGGGVVGLLAAATVRGGGRRFALAGGLAIVAGAGCLLLVHLVDPLERARGVFFVRAPEGAAMLRTPVESSEQVAGLRPGQLVEVLSVSGRWAHGETEGGVRGWFPLETTTPLVPADREVSGAAAGEG
jgi:outer membrane lipoprotein SlyB